VIFYSLTYEIPINTWFAPRSAHEQLHAPPRSEIGVLFVLLSFVHQFSIYYYTPLYVLFCGGITPSILTYINHRKVSFWREGLVGEVGMRGGAELIPRNRNYFI